MSEVYAYEYRDTKEVTVLEAKTSEEDNIISKHSKAKSLLEKGGIASAVGTTQKDQAAARFRPIHGIHGIATRFLYLCAITALAGFTT